MGKRELGGWVWYLSRCIDFHHESWFLGFLFGHFCTEGGRGSAGMGCFLGWIPDCSRM